MKKVTDWFQRLKENTIVDPQTNCWLHQYVNKAKGYAFATFEGKQVAVHRLSAYRFLGYDLADTEHQINHQLHCPNLNCWNPDHIYIGTQTENMQDTVKLGTHGAPNRNKTHCKHGHEYTPENTYIKKQNGHRQCWICMRDRDARRIR